MRRTFFYRFPRRTLQQYRSRPERPLLPPSQVCLTKTPTSVSSSRTRFPTSKPLFSSKKWGNLIPYGTLWPCLLKSPVNRRCGVGASKLFYTSSESIVCVSVKDAVLAKWSCLSDKKGTSFTPNSLQDVLNLPHSLPEITRPFWRASRLRPEDALGILNDFEGGAGKGVVEGRDVEFCWRLFNWADGQGLGFQHLPQSYRVMVSMLVWDGRVGEVEALLHKMEMSGIELGSGEVFSRLIECYVEANELKKSIAGYDRAKTEGLILSESCYLALLDCFTRVREFQLAQRILFDAVDIGWKLCAEKHHGLAIETLCKGRMILEARTLLNRIVDLGIKPDGSVLRAVVDGYCEKQDYIDLLMFLKDWKYMPDVSLCNKIIASQCKSLGTEKASQFLRHLELLGFVPNAITFAILIGWSCRAGRLKEGFLHLSTNMSRGLKADIQAYHSLIGGLFKHGMGKHAKDILSEMYEKGVIPLASTYKILVAGYCRNREFDDVKQMVSEMVKRGFISLLPTEDLLTKAFEMLGLNHLNVKIKRDNSENLVGTEFFDSLGNGLYLETNIDLFEKALSDILSDSIVPNLNLALTQECKNGNVKDALEVKNIMFQWDQKLSLSSYAKLIETLSSSDLFSDVDDLVSEVVDMRNELHEDTLNLLIQASLNRKMMPQMRHILDEMHQRELCVEKSSFVSLILCFCEQRDKEEVRKCLNTAIINGWQPTSKEWKAILCQLCKLGMVVEVLEFFEFLNKSHYKINNVCSSVVKGLCVGGLTCLGHLFISENYRRGVEIDNRTLNHLMWGFCKEQNFDKALEVFEWAYEKNMSPSLKVFEVLIAHLCRSNELEKALAFKKIMSSRQLGISSLVYCCLVNGLSRIEKTRDGIFLLHEMNVGGMMVCDECCEVILRGMCQRNHVILLPHIFEFLCFMIRMDVKFSVSIFRSLVKMMCKFGRFDDVLKLKCFTLTNHNQPPAAVYNVVLFQFFCCGQVFPALRLLDEMHAKSLSLDHVSYNILIQGYCKCGMTLKAAETLDNMINNNIKPSNRSFRIAVTYFASNGLCNKALSLSKKMELRGWMNGLTVPTMILDFLLLQGKFLDAEQLFDQMMGRNIVLDGFCCDVLIKRFCHHGRFSKAIKLLNMILTKGILPADVSYCSIICGLCLQGSLDQALDFHAEMLHKNLIPSTKCFEMLIHKLCNSGRTLEAESLLLSMCMLGQTPKQSVFQVVIDQCLEDKNINKASEIFEVMRQKGYQADFRTQWSLISNLKEDKEDNSNSMGFLSRLLSRSGFHTKDNKSEQFRRYINPHPKKNTSFKSDGVE